MWHAAFSVHSFKSIGNKTNPALQDAASQFQALQKVYETLGDPDKRLTDHPPFQAFSLPCPMCLPSVAPDPMRITPVRPAGKHTTQQGTLETWRALHACAHFARQLPDPHITSGR